MSAPRESIWISYSRIEGERDPYHLSQFTSHHRLASPVEPWEELKIGGGTPPILTRHGWLVVYHGVQKVSEPGAEDGRLRYSAGLMVLSRERPNLICYRAAKAVLAPDPAEDGWEPDHIVFPTAIDRRDDLGMPDRLDVYFGMADRCVGVMRLMVPEHLALRPI